MPVGRALALDLPGFEEGRRTIRHAEEWCLCGKWSLAVFGELQLPAIDTDCTSWIDQPGAHPMLI